MSLFDVVVIGGGPVGSRAAYRLAGMGHSVIVVEQKEWLGGPVCCTGIISLECVKQFAIDENVILRWANSAKVFSPSGNKLGLRRLESVACIVDRPAFNLALARKAQDVGAEYILNSPVKGVDVRSDRVSIWVGRRGGGLDSIEARAVVLATGSGSKLVEGLGFGRVGDFTMGAQATVDTNGVDEVEIYLGRRLAPAFFAWLVPISSRQALVGLLSRRKTGFYLKKLISSLVADGKIISETTELSFAPVPLKPLSRTYADRLIVVGSAAGQVKPTTGGGIYYGLLCADIAADSLHWALESDNLSGRSLASYEKGWRRRLGREIQLGYWSRKFFELLSDRRLDSIFNIVKSKGIAEELLKAEDLSFDWHSGTIMKLLGHRALAGTVGKIRLPPPSGDRGRR